MTKYSKIIFFLILIIICSLILFLVIVKPYRTEAIRVEIFSAVPVLANRHVDEGIVNLLSPWINETEKVFISPEFINIKYYPYPNYQQKVLNDLSNKKSIYFAKAYRDKINSEIIENIENCRFFLNQQLINDENLFKAELNKKTNLFPEENTVVYSQTIKRESVFWGGKKYRVFNNLDSIRGYLNKMVKKSPKSVFLIIYKPMQIEEKKPPTSPPQIKPTPPAPIKPTLPPFEIIGEFKFQIKGLMSFIWNNESSIVKVHDSKGNEIDSEVRGVLEYDISKIIDKLQIGNTYRITIYSLIDNNKTISCDFYIDPKGQLCCKCC